LRPLKDLHDGQTGKDYWFCLPGITNAVVVAALIRVNVGDGARKRHCGRQKLSLASCSCMVAVGQGTLSLLLEKTVNDSVVMRVPDEYHNGKM